jgi:putative colanic acid biosynthesis acetyltransferase WcaF
MERMNLEARPPLRVDLRLHSPREDQPDGYRKGRSFPIRVLWSFVNALLFQNPVLPAYKLKTHTLRLFGATIGEGVVIKPRVTIKHPWYLTIGDHSWIGEAAWLECASYVRIGTHVAISQGAFLVSGGHDWSDPGMGTIGQPIIVEDGAWVAAFAVVAGGVTIEQEAVVGLGAVVLRDCEVRGIYKGNPAQLVGRRELRGYPGPKRTDETV